jgi:hypothetical protein
MRESLQRRLRLRLAAIPGERAAERRAMTLQELSELFLAEHVEARWLMGQH